MYTDGSTAQCQVYESDKIYLPSNYIQSSHVPHQMILRHSQVDCSGDTLNHSRPPQATGEGSTTLDSTVLASLVANEGTGMGTEMKGV